MKKISQKKKATISVKPEVCKDCIRWKLYGRECRFYWKGKRECYSKAVNADEMIYLDNLRIDSARIPL